jgi:predicted RNA-binding protein with PIN domain
VASDLFDPLLELALDVARQGKKAKPAIATPARLDPMLRFAKVPNKAKDDILDILDTDPDFRARVSREADERTVGRVGIAFLERPDGWKDFVDQMVDAAEEPIIESASVIARVEKRLLAAESARDRTIVERDAAFAELHARQTDLDVSTAEKAAALHDVEILRAENVELVLQRQRAVAELKKTEQVMARHVGERKRLEAVLDAMTSAQLSSTAVGAGITDVEVRAAVDSIEDAMADVQGQLDVLRRASTPERIPVARRTPLSVPHGLFDDSEKFAEYLLSVPKMSVLVDGYNVTKEAHGDWELERQRTWLGQGLLSLAKRLGASFHVVFDGADVSSTGRTGRSPEVQIRFSPSGVEADDVLIEAVGHLDATRPVTVVSSDNRVRDGAAERGANVLYSRQLLALL